MEAFHTALKRGDKAAALALLDEAVAIFESGEVEQDRQIKNRSLETMILKHGQNGWHIVHIHWSSARLKAN